MSNEGPLGVGDVSSNGANASAPPVNLFPEFDAATLAKLEATLRAESVEGRKVIEGQLGGLVAMVDAASKAEVPAVAEDAKKARANLAPLLEMLERVKKSAAPSAPAAAEPAPAAGGAPTSASSSPVAGAASAASAPAQATTPPVAAAAPAAPRKPKPDPYAVPANMARMPEIAYLWSSEAIEATRYTKEVERKGLDGVTRIVEEDAYAPLDGVLTGYDRLGGVLQFITYASALVGTAHGKLVERPAGTLVVVKMNHSLHKVMRFIEVQPDGSAEVQHVHARLVPMGKVTMVDGVVEWAFDLLIERREDDPTMPKLVSPESARVAA